MKIAIVGGGISGLVAARGLSGRHTEAVTFTAGRIMLELKSKLEKGWGSLVSAYPTQDTASVVAALTNLGYSPGDAARAAAALPAAPDLSLEDRVKMALRHLSS